ncbi:M23 family metallopeptidase [Maribellus sp. YY47]|uniref:M23 family metallopeptidase n=1 Tax=Maribellus sp. YY47 TaxID=2929486 RepID=UPI002000E3EB|nr:M23 family metallopeptidase [Maribellus sp. YY47]MCK3682726.1 M23 family metallopeptidase [Maribellus sp. YY47]
MKVFFLLLIVSFVVVFQSNAQYVNTDELVIVPGKEEPVSLAEYGKIQKQQNEQYQSFLAGFLVPGNGGKVISDFGPRSGRMHYGTDIKMERGDTVFAVNDGSITRAGWGSGFGNIMIIQHANNIETYYAHLSKFLMKEGEYVKKGEAIALAGSTGRARGSHLHFEIREEGRAFDPELVFDFGRQEIREDALNFENLVALHRTLKPKGYSNNAAIPEYYKVRSGDSLWVISRKFKTPIKDLCRLNNITENSVLQIGQPLKMY